MRWQTRKACHFDDGLISQLEPIGCVKTFEMSLDMGLGLKLNQLDLKKNSIISLILPILTLSEANGILSKTRFCKNGKPKSEHWTEKQERHKMQKRAIFYNLSPHRDAIHLPCTVRMVRLAPRELDADDNLRIALKWIKDAIAEVITQDFVPGRADGDKRIKWEYDQEKCKEYKVKIEIW